MSLRYLLDENQRGLLWRTVQRHNASGGPAIDAVRVGDSPALPLGSDDLAILRWAESEERILVTFDKQTLAGHLATHLQGGNHSPGVFMIRPGFTLPRLVEHLDLASQASDAWEWRDRIEHIPY